MSEVQKSTLIEENKPGRKSILPAHNPEHDGKGHFDKVQTATKIILTILWIALIVVCFIFKDEITIDEVIKLTPSEPVLASLVMVLLFGLKSLCVVIWVGVLYAATGLMFPLHEAIFINILGTVVMVIVPYLIGKSEGRHAVSYCVKRYPRIKRLQEFTDSNGFFLSVLIRSNGILPCDVMSLYLGAVETPFIQYILSSTIGLLPLAISFPLVAPYMANPLSWQFVTAVVVNLIIMALSFLAMFILKMKSK